MMSVKIDRYEIVDDKSPMMKVYDNKLQKTIATVNINNKEYNIALAQILLDELNTGHYEEEDES